MTDIQHIPLNKLVAWEGNARRTVSDEGIAELAASIKTDGLINPLTVIAKGKKFNVVAGSRRLRALQLLAERNELPNDNIRCTVLPEDADAVQISLAENVVRENMHPADEFEAFRDLIDKGKSIEDVAAAFGVTRTVVEKRLKLARVSPKVLQAYRDGKLNLEKVMAFAISDDHEAQDELLADLKPYFCPDTIRDHLTESELHCDTSLAKFVGIKAYEKAGGTLKRDLFSEEDDAYIEDVALLRKLAMAKLEKEAAKIRKEGWKWVEAREKFDYNDRCKFKQVYAQKAPLPAELEAEVKKLQAEKEKLEEAYYADEDAEWPDRIDEIDARLDEIEDRPANFTPEQMAYAGAVVSIDYNGKLDVTRGLVRPEDMPKPEGKAAGAKASKSSASDETEEQALPSPQPSSKA